MIAVTDLSDDVTLDLIDDICAAPADDGPRLVWADAVGGERGELVVIQLALERGGLEPRAARALRRRQRELLAASGAAWASLDIDNAHARRASFRRGFVDAVEVRAFHFTSFADQLFAAAPLLESLALYGLENAAGAQLARIVEHPAYRRIRALELVGMQRYPVEYLAGTLGDVSHLRALAITDSELAIGRVPEAWHHLERLRTRVPAERLDIARMERLFAVALRGPLERLPERITELALDNATDDDLSLLPPALARLELTNAVVSRPFACRRLAALAIDGLLDVRALDPRALPSIRELAIRAPLDEAATRTVVRAFGPQLDLLDLRGNRHALRHLNDLKQHVAGELLVASAGAASPGLLRAGPAMQMPWWDHVAL